MAADILTFVVAISGSLIVHVVGDLPVADLLLLPLLPVLLILRARSLNRRHLKAIFGLLGLWITGQITTDVYRRTDAASWMRTDARIVFFALNLAALAILVGKNTRRQVLFFAGMGIGGVLQTRFQPTPFTDFWKFGYAAPVTVIVVLVSCYFYKRRLYVVFLLPFLALSAVHAAFNFRSPIVFLFITAVIITPFIPEHVGRVRLLPASPMARLVFLVVLALGAANIASSLVLYLSSRGYLGEGAAAKNARQAESKLGVLVGGRPEILVSSRAVMDSPILGHGAAARDYKYTDMYRDLELKYDIPAGGQHWDEVMQGLIPTHSHLMGAWVEGGILGAMFWTYIFLLAGRAVIRIAAVRPWLAPIYTYSLVAFLWNILFSPGGGLTVLPEAFLLVLICNFVEVPSVAVPAQRNTPVRMRPRLTRTLQAAR